MMERPVGWSVVGMMLVGLAPAGFAQRPTAPSSSASARRVPLPKALSRSVAVRWENVPLRRLLYDLGRQQSLELFLDRRIDPDQPIALHVRNPQPVGLVLHRVAFRARSAVVPLESILYVAPENEAWQIGTAYDRLRGAWLRGADAAMRRRRSLSWKTPGTPREILEAWCRAHDVRLRELDPLPHDLWLGADLGRVGFPAGTALLIAGFGFEGVWNADQRELAIRRRTMSAPDAGIGFFFAVPGLDRGELVDRFSGAGLRWQRRGPWWVVRGSPESLSTVGRFLAQFRPHAAARGASRSRLTFRVRQQPLGAVLKTLEQQLQLTFELSPEASRELSRRVTFTVERATLSETLRAIFQPIGLSFRQEGQRVKVTIERPVR